MTTVPALRPPGGAATVGAWLEALALRQYTPAFISAGYDDLAIIAHLDDADLDAINATLAAEHQRLAGVGRLTPPHSHVMYDLPYEPNILVVFPASLP